MGILFSCADSSICFGLRAEEMSYLDSQCIILGFCTVWYKITTRHKNQTQSYERYKFHLLPNGNSFLVDQPHQGKGWHLLLYSCKRKAGLRGSPGFPSSSTPLDLSLPRNDRPCVHAPPASSDHEIAAKPAVYLCGDSSNHTVTPTKSKHLPQSLPFRQNYHRQAF